MMQRVAGPRGRRRVRAAAHGRRARQPGRHRGGAGRLRLRAQRRARRGARRVHGLDQRTTRVHAAAPRGDGAVRVLVLGGEGMLGHKVFQVLSRRFDTVRHVPRRRRAVANVPAVRRPARVTAARRGRRSALRRASPRRSSRRVPTPSSTASGIIKQLKEASDPILDASPSTRCCRTAWPSSAPAAGARLVHMSTDCVFSGRKGAYTEDDLPDPEDLYGRSKLLGEVDRPGCLTIRTSIFGRDFLKQDALLEWFLANRGGRVKGYRNARLQRLSHRRSWRASSAICWPTSRRSTVLFRSPARRSASTTLLMMLKEAMALDIEIEPFDDPPCDRSLSCGPLRAGHRLPPSLLGGDGGRSGRGPDPLRRVEAGPCIRLRASEC